MARTLALVLSFALGLSLVTGSPADGATADEAADGATASPASPPPIEVVSSTGNDPASWRTPRPGLAWDAPRDRGVVVEVDTDHLGAPIDGVGAALTESSAALLVALPDATRDALLRSLYDPAGDVGFSVVRVPLGASDFSLWHSPVSGTYQDARDPASFTLARAEDQLEVLRELTAIRPDLTVIAAPWSPPAWAKTFGSLYGGSLRDDAVVDYRDYLLRTVDAYAAAGIAIDRLALHNEVRHAPWDYPGARIGHRQLAVLSTLIRPGLTARGVELLALDHNAEDVPHAVSLLDEVAPGTIDAVALHCYGGDLGLADVLHDVHPGVAVDVTECTSGAWSTDRNANLRWDVRELVVAGSRLGARTVVKWNLALDPWHGPRVGGCTDCTGVVTVDPSTGTTRFEHDVHALAHLADGLTPGARWAASSSSPGHGIATTATTDGHAHQLLLVHDAGTTRQVTVRWGGARTLLDLPPWSVTTVRWTGAMTGGAKPATPGGITGREVRGRAVLTWSATAGATRYLVERAPGTKGPWTRVAEVPATPTPRWHDRDRERGTTATYRVAADGLRGTGGWSATTTVAVPTAIGVGTDVQAEDHDAQSGVTRVRCGSGCLAAGGLSAGRWLTHDRVELTGARALTVVASTTSASRLRVTDGSGRALATVELPDTGGALRSTTVPLAPTSGVGSVTIAGDTGEVTLDRWRVAR